MEGFQISQMIIEDFQIHKIMQKTELFLKHKSEVKTIYAKECVNHWKHKSLYIHAERIHHLKIMEKTKCYNVHLWLRWQKIDENHLKACFNTDFEIRVLIEKLSKLRQLV